MRNRRALLLLLTLVACGRQTPEEALAVFDGGIVSRDDLDGRVLALPEAERVPPDGDFEAWHRSLIRQAGLDAVLLRMADSSGFQQSAEFARQWDELRCQTLAAAYFRHQEFAVEASEAAAREYFAEHRDEFVEPARRQVAHIYVRRRDGEADAALEARANELRRRIAGGENFESVARRFSDSESRHRGGELGWVAAGRLDPKAESVVFALAEGSLSEPVVTRDGAHLFRVQQAVEGREYSFAEVRQTVAQKVASAATEAQVDALLAGVEFPSDSFVPSDEELRTLLRAGNPEALVLRLGDFTLDVGELGARLQAAASGGAAGNASPSRIVHALERQRGLCRLAEQERLDSQPEVAQALERARRALTVQMFRRAHLLEWLRADEARVARHFEENRTRFQTALRFRLATLTVPLGDNPNGRMAALEAAREPLDRGEMTLEDLRRRWQGSITESGWVDLARLRAGEANVAEFASRLEAGRHSPPYLAAAGLEIFRVEAREAPHDQELDAVREQVVQHMLTTHGEALYREFGDAMLAAAHFELLAERIAELRPDAP